MLDRETKERISDYFEAGELVDFLQLRIGAVLDAFEEEVEEPQPAKKVARKIARKLG